MARTNTTSGGGGGSMTIGGAITGGVAPAVLFVGVGNVLDQDPGKFDYVKATGALTMNFGGNGTLDYNPTTRVWKTGFYTGGGAGSATIIDDTAGTFTFQTNSSNHLIVGSSLGTSFFGDTGVFGNGTNMSMDDTLRTITLNAVNGVKIPLAQKTLTVADSPYTVLVSDQILLVNTAGGDVTIDLPLATTLVKRDIYIVKTSASNMVYVNTTGSDFLNQSTSLSLTNNKQELHLESVSPTQWVGEYNFSEMAVSPTIVKAATSANLTSVTYNNGVAGVGATITHTINGVIPALSGVTVVNGDLVLIKNQAAALQNGVYIVTDQGSAGTPYILTRDISSDTTGELSPQIVIPTQGTTSTRGRQWSQTFPNPVIGTDPITYADISGNPVPATVVTQEIAGTQVSGQIPFWTAVTQQLSRGNAGFVWDNTKKILTVSANGNVLIGNSTTGGSLVAGLTNVFIGAGAGAVQTNASGNTFVGDHAGFTNVSGVFNAFFGADAGRVSTGSRDSFFGAEAGKSNTTGVDNSFFGRNAGGANVGGGDNTAIGSQAGAAAVSSNDWSYVGYHSGITATGDRNAFFGASSGAIQTSGDDNLYVGTNSGQSNGTGSKNTLIGTGADTSTSSTSNSIALGYGAVAAANTFVVGSGSVSIGNVYFGNGMTNASAASVFINATGGSGSNNSGATMNIVGGIGTGTGNGGDVRFRVAYPGTTGSTPNSTLAVMTILASNNQSSGTATLVEIGPVVNQTGTAGYTAFKLNAAEASTGSGTKLLVDFQTTGASKFSIDNAGIITNSNRLYQPMATVASANDLTLTTANTFSITGNTQVNAITTTGWTAGSHITLIFTSNPTIKNNTAGGAGTAKIFLAGSIDMTAATNTVLCLAYDGTQWQETSRKVA